MLTKLRYIGLFVLFFSGSAYAMELTSSAFSHNGPIPARYTCDGANISPALSWRNVPAHAKSLVLIVDDPDATNGTWDHWIIFNIPASATNIAENQLPAGAKSGANSWNKNEYGGPCPPHGTHRYQFHLYALDTNLNLPAGANKQQIMQAMQGHVMDEVELIGLYARK